MRYLLLSICFVALGFSAQASFEGVIKLNTVNPEIGEKSNITWFTKGGQHKMEYSGVAGEEQYNYTLFFSSTSSTMTMITESNGQLIRYESPVDQIESTTPQGFNMEVAKTDNTKVIAGLKAQQVKIEDSKGKTTMWVSGELKLSLDNLPSVLKKSGVFQKLASAGVVGFPLEVVSTDLSGDLVMSQTVTSIEEKTLEEGTFEIPSNAITIQEYMESKSGK